MARKKATLKVVTKPVMPKKSRARTPPFKNYEPWTEAKFWSFIRSGLRSTYNKWPPKWEVLKEAKRPYTGQSKQQKWEYLCSSCNKYYKQKDISVDHIVPAGSLNNFSDLAGFVERLFVDTSGLQVLCTECHRLKTKDDKNKNG
jgi:5-methylcytosine-specific restriction endonuclease McrA